MPTPLTTSSERRYLAWVIGLWAVVFSAYSIFLHEVYRSTVLDLGLHSQILWNLAHGRFMETSFFPYSFAANHFWPAFYLLVPVYQGLGVPGLLVLQSLVVAAGALPAYLLARDITGSGAWARAFAFAYLLQPTLSVGVLFDYHLELFAVPFAMAAVLAFRRNHPSAWLWAALACSFYEVNAGLFFFFGTGLLFVRGRRLAGLALALLSLIYLLALFFVIIPHFRGHVIVPHPDRYAHLGPSAAEAFHALAAHPLQSLGASVTFKDVRMLGSLLFSFSFLSLLSVKHLAPAVPLVALLLLSNWGLQMDIRYGYLAPALPFLLLSAAHGARVVKSARGPAILAGAALVLFVYYQAGRPLRPHPFTLRPNLAEIRQASALIPPEAGLSADNHLGAHFPNRRILLVTPAVRTRGQTADFIFADLGEFTFKDSDWWAQMEQRAKGTRYGPVYFSNDVVLLRAGVTNAALSEAVLARLREQAGKAEARYSRKAGRAKTP